MKLSKITSLFLVGSIAFLTGCGGGGSSESTSTTTVSTSTKITGTVVDELISNGIVKVHEGSLSGKILAETRTDDKGIYNVTVNYTGPVIIEVDCDSNSTFIDSNGIKTSCTLREPLLSATIADGTTTQANTTPITTELVALAVNGDLNKTITSEDLQKAKQVITYLYGIDPVVENPVSDSTYNKIIETLHTVAKENNSSIMEIVENFINDSKDGIIGNDNNITNIVFEKLKEENIQTPFIEANLTEVNLSQVADTNIDGITATRNVIQSLRDNLYSISNEDRNGTLDKEVKDFNDAINRDVIKNTENSLFAFSYVLDAVFDSNASMSGTVSQNGNTYEYNVTAEENNTKFNYTINWNGKDYKGVVTTSQDYKDINSVDDLNSDMWFEINGSLPSTDNKVIYAKGIAHKNDDNTFTFNLVNAQIKGDKDMLQIKDIQIDGKYFTYVNDENKTNTDLSYIKFNNIELNSLIDNRFEINGTLSINWVQNNYVKNEYPEGTFQTLDWLEAVITCENENNETTAPIGGTIYFNFNNSEYSMSSVWKDSYEQGFKLDNPDEIMLAYEDGDLENYIENYNNYDLSNIECPSGYSAKINNVWYDDGDSFANDGYVPNNITFTGDIKDLNTSVEIKGKIEAQSSDIDNVDITTNYIPNYKITLNVELKRPEYPDTLLNADFTYFDSNKTSSLSMSYNYGNDVITLLGNWNEDQSGNVLITDAKGVKIVIPVDTAGNIIFDKSTVLYNGEQIGTLEDRGDNIPVIHFNDGSVESIY